MHMFIACHCFVSTDHFSTINVAINVIHPFEFKFNQFTSKFISLHYYIHWVEFATNQEYLPGFCPYNKDNVIKIYEVTWHVLIGVSYRFLFLRKKITFNDTR